MSFSIFEAGILVWIQEHLRLPVLNEIMIGVTSLGNGGIFWIAMALLLICIKRTRRIGLQCGIAMLLTLLVVNLALKPLLARTRPYELIDHLQILISRPRDYSFPSGHSANSFSCAWVIFRKMPRKIGTPAILLAGLISLSRLYVGVHFPTDVLCGALVAVLLAEIGMRAFAKIENTSLLKQR